MARLFLSYRRSDTGAYADRLAERLATFQFDAVFLDREAIGLGANFADDIRRELSLCTAVLVLMGIRWIDIQGEQGQRRLDEPTDWVRREVALALNMRLPVIPVVFDSAPRPTLKDLPGELAPLTTSEGYDINGNYFDRDATDLGKRLEKMLVASARAAASSSSASSTSSRLTRQLQISWIGFFFVTLATSVAPVAVRGLPQSFWLFPGTMTVAAFLWWLYWLGETLRPARTI